MPPRKNTFQRTPPEGVRRKATRSIQPPVAPSGRLVRPRSATTARPIKGPATYQGQRVAKRSMAGILLRGAARMQPGGGQAAAAPMFLTAAQRALRRALLKAAGYRTKSQVEHLVAERF